VRRLLFALITLIGALYIYFVLAVEDHKRWFRHFSDGIKKDHESARIHHAFKSKPLQQMLLAVIEQQDSLSKASPIHSKHTSYWVVFHQQKDTCFVSLLANFNFYSSKRAIGHIELENRFITFYTDDKDCGSGLVDWARLKKGQINGLQDYDRAGWKDTVPPPPSPTHEPFKREYRVISNDSLQIVYEGY
jgi:hypothetical protein